MAAGTMRKLQLDGTPFNLPADIDMAEMVGQEVEGLATSGPTMYKITKKVATREGVVIVCDDDDWELLQALQERAFNAEPAWPASYTNVNGQLYTATVHINIESRQTAENKATIVMIPETGWSKL